MNFATASRGTATSCGAGRSGSGPRRGSRPARCRPRRGRTARPRTNATASLGWMRTAAEYVDCATRPGATPARAAPAAQPGRVRQHRPRPARRRLRLRAARSACPRTTAGDGFDNLAASLGLSPALMEKYFAAADKIVEAVFARRRQRRQRPQTPVRRPARPGPPRARGGPPGRHPPRPPRLPQAARRGRPRPPARVLRPGQPQGEPFEDAVRAVLKPVLVSPQFLFRIEEDRPAPGKAPGVAGRRPRAGRPAVVLPLVHDARRRAVPAGRRGKALRPGRARRAGPADAGRPQGPRPDRQLRRAVAAAQEAGQRPADDRVLPDLQRPAQAGDARRGD